MATPATAEDIRVLTELGLTTYRFSIEWARIGRGRRVAARMVSSPSRWPSRS